jgi:hypothetical protein
VLAAPPVLYWLWRQREEWGVHARLLLGATLAAGVFLLLNLRFTLAIWEQVPLLALFQFPWRLLGPLAFLVALMGGLYAALLTRPDHEGRSSRRAARVFEGVVLTGCILNALLIHARVMPLTDEEWRSYDADFRGGATVYNEYIPRGAVAGIWMLQPATSGPLVRPPEDVRANWTTNHGARIEGEVVTARPTLLAFGRWALPEWRATLDGRPARWLRSPEGTLLLPVPAGSHRVALVLDPPPLRRIFWPVSLVTAMVSLLIWLVWFWRRRRA